MFFKCCCQKVSNLKLELVSLQNGIHNWWILNLGVPRCPKTWTYQISCEFGWFGFQIMALTTGRSMGTHPARLRFEAPTASKAPGQKSQRLTLAAGNVWQLPCWLNNHWSLYYGYTVPYIQQLWGTPTSHLCWRLPACHLLLDLYPSCWKSIRHDVLNMEENEYIFKLR